MRRISKLVLHHTAEHGDQKQYATVDSYHKRKWGRGIEYHFFIEKDGEVLEGKPVEEIGYQAGNWSVNVVSVGICLAGDFTHEFPTTAQLDSLVQLVAKLQNIYLIPDNEIWLHREVRLTPTECPGIDLRDIILSRKEVPLKRRLKIAQNGLKWSRGLRRKMLIRLIQRIQKRLGLIDAPDV